MTLFDDGKVLIKVAINEGVPKEVNARIPYGPEEVADDAVACAAAGAAVVHFHSRLADGTQALDDDAHGANIYRRALELTADRCDVLLEPTNIPAGPDPTLASMTPAVWALLDNPPAGARLETTSLDAFRFAPPGLSARGKSLSGLGTLTDATPFDGPEVIRETLRRGVLPCFGLFELGDARVLAAFAAAGVVTPPLLIQLNFYWDRLVGPTPSVAAIDAYLDEWSRLAVDAEICLSVQHLPDRETYDRLMTAALVRRIHIRAGSGDNPRVFASNAESVEHTVDLAIRQDLTPVTPAELRLRFGLPAATWPP